MKNPLGPPLLLLYAEGLADRLATGLNTGWQVQAMGRLVPVQLADDTRTMRSISKSMYSSVSNTRSPRSVCSRPCLPKYRPPVSSRRMSMLQPWMRSSLSGDESTSSG